MGKDIFRAGEAVTITNTTQTEEMRVYPFRYSEQFSGAITLAGKVKLLSGTAPANINANIKLVFKEDSAIDGKQIASDTAALVTLNTSTGGSVASKLTGVGSIASFEVDLAAESFWKPCIGMMISFGSTTGTYTAGIEAVVIPIKY